MFCVWLHSTGESDTDLKDSSPSEQATGINLWERLGKSAMLDIESSSFCWENLSSLHHTEHSGSTEQSDEDMYKTIEVWISNRGNNGDSLFQWNQIIFSVKLWKHVKNCFSFFSALITNFSLWKFLSPPMGKNHGHACIFWNGCDVAKNSYDIVITRMQPMDANFLKKKKSYKGSFELIIAFLFLNYYYYAITTNIMSIYNLSDLNNLSL